MCDINLRNVDPALKTELKIEAAQHGMTFKAYCVALLSGNFWKIGYGEAQETPEKYEE